MTEGFFRRWSRVKAEARPESAPPAEPSAIEPAATESGRSVTPPPGKALPTLQDVGKLTADSDYSAFVAKGVDATVRRQALKKLFADPHFNVMDGLDIYIDDYNRASPLPPAMLAMLQQAQGFLVTDKKNEAIEDGTPAEETAEVKPAGNDGQQGDSPSTEGNA